MARNKLDTKIARHEHSLARKELDFEPKQESNPSRSRIKQESNPACIEPKHISNSSWNRPKPVRSQPVRPKLVQSQPVRSQPVLPKPVRSQPVRSQPVRSQPVLPKPVRSQPVRSQPVLPKPVLPKPVRSQFVLRMHENTDGRHTTADGRQRNHAGAWNVLHVRHSLQFGQICYIIKVGKILLLRRRENGWKSFYG